jgi:hypothetical protein
MPDAQQIVRQPDILILEGLNVLQVDSQASEFVSDYFDFLAAMLIGVIRQFANYYVTGLGDFVIVILLAGVLLIRPQGLLGKVRA